MAHEDDLLPIGQLIGDLKGFAAENGCRPDALDHLDYRRVLDAVLSARIPAERIRSRWHYRRGNRARIAAAFGVVPTGATPAAAA